MSNNKREIRLDFIGGRRPAFLSQSEDSKAKPEAKATGEKLPQSETLTKSESTVIETTQDKTYKPIKDDAVKIFEKLAEEAIKNRNSRISRITDAVKQDIDKWNNFCVNNECRKFVGEKEVDSIVEKFDFKVELNDVEKLHEELTMQTIELASRHKKLCLQCEIVKDFVDTAYNNIDCNSDNLFNDTPRHLIKKILKSDANNFVAE